MSKDTGNGKVVDFPTAIPERLTLSQRIAVTVSQKTLQAAEAQYQKAAEQYQAVLQECGLPNAPGYAIKEDGTVVPPAVAPEPVP